MGAAIDAIGRTGDALRRNPVLAAGALLIAVGTSVSQVASNFIPLVGSLVALLYFFVEPLLTGGYLGMANEAVDGDTDIDGFVRSARENYLRLLGARLLVLGVAIGAGILLVIVAVVLGAGLLGSLGSASQGAEPGAIGAAAGAASLGIIGVFLVVGLVTIVLVFLLQFYQAAIVLADAGVLESFKYSYKLVTANVVSVLGYSALVVVFSVVFQGLTLAVGGGGAALAAFSGAGSDAALGASIAIFLAVTFVATVLSVLLLRTYYVAFVREVTGTV